MLGSSKFHQISFRGYRGKVENVSANESEAREAAFD